MLWVSVPWELASVHLLELQDVPPLLRDHFSHSAGLIERGQLVQALAAVDQLAEIAAAQRDRYTGALALVLRADVLRRMARWEGSLDAIRRALHRLELRVSPVARYNEGVAVYLEGVVHYMLRAEEKVVATFAYAQEVLADSERHWGFEHNDARAADCRDIVRWMRRLMELQAEVGFGDVAMVMPVYELVNRTVVRTDAAVVYPLQIMIPDRVVAEYSPPEVRPVQLDVISLLVPHPQTQYVAIRVPKDEPGVGLGREGDLLIIEVTGSSSASGELILTSDKPFVRRQDGRVEFRSSARRNDLGADHARSGLMGIPRVLIRERGAE
jgi:hypothetical protein